MNRYVGRFAVASALVLMAGTGTAWAQGPAYPETGQVEGKVVDVNHRAQTITLDDGTLLSATSPQQLMQVKPGSSVAVTFVDEGYRKDISNIEPLAD